MNKLIEKIRNLLVDLALPKTENDKKNWLAAMEVGNIAGAVVFILLFVLFVLEKDIFIMAKYAGMALVVLIMISVQNMLQYQMSIEFNTRKK